MGSTGSLDFVRWLEEGANAGDGIKGPLFVVAALLVGLSGRFS